VILRPGHSFTLEEMQRFFAEHQMAKQYWPEFLAVCEDVPRTPSGKIQKFRLREMAKEQFKAASA
jgi:Acyl-CoA synthetases (AMP-forming)/AMP-acid ligases II